MSDNCSRCGQALPDLPVGTIVEYHGSTVGVMLGVVVPKGDIDFADEIRFVPIMGLAPGYIRVVKRFQVKEVHGHIHIDC